MPQNQQTVKQKLIIWAHLFILLAFWKVYSISFLSKWLICQKIGFWRKPDRRALNSLFCLKENGSFFCSMRCFCCWCCGNSASSSDMTSFQFMLLAACTLYILLNFRVIRECSVRRTPLQNLEAGCLRTGCALFWWQKVTRAWLTQGCLSHHSGSKQQDDLLGVRPVYQWIWKIKRKVTQNAAVTKKCSS